MDGPGTVLSDERPERKRGASAVGRDFLPLPGSCRCRAPGLGIRLPPT